MYIPVLVRGMGSLCSPPGVVLRTPDFRRTMYVRMEDICITNGMEWVLCVCVFVCMCAVRRAVVLYTWKIGKFKEVVGEGLSGDHC